MEGASQVVRHRSLTVEIPPFLYCPIYARCFCKRVDGAFYDPAVKGPIRRVDEPAHARDRRDSDDESAPASLPTT